MMGDVLLLETFTAYEPGTYRPSTCGGNNASSVYCDDV
jgi:hypothetical protein